MVYLFIANGSEEVESLAPVDILRRGGIDVTTVGVGGKTLTLSRNVMVVADITEDELDLSDMDAIILPGGMPGTINLENSENVQSALKKAVDENKIIGAICAAPSILGNKGYLSGKKATCYPGCEEGSFIGAVYTGETVTVDGNIITGKGPGAAICFGLKLLECLKDKETADNVMESLQCPK